MPQQLPSIHEANAQLLPSIHEANKKLASPEMEAVLRGAEANRAREAQGKAAMAAYAKATPLDVQAVQDVTGTTPRIDPNQVAENRAEAHQPTLNYTAPKDGYWVSAAKSAWNGLVNMLPQLHSFNKLNELPTNYEDILAYPEKNKTARTAAGDPVMKYYEGVPKNFKNIEKTIESLSQSSSPIKKESAKILKEIQEKMPDAPEETKRDYFGLKFNKFLGKNKLDIWNEIAEQAKESEELMKNVPKTPGEGFIGWAGSAGGQVLGSMATMAYGGPMGIALAEGVDAYQEGLKAKAEAMSERYGIKVTPEMLAEANDDADVKHIANNVGAVNAVLEQIGLFTELGPIAKSLITKKITREALKAGVWKDVRTALSSNFLEEFAQDANQQFGTNLAKGMSKEEAVAKIKWDQSLLAGEAGAAGALPFAGIGAGIKGTKQFIQQAKAQQLSTGDPVLDKVQEEAITNPTNPAVVEAIVNTPTEQQNAVQVGSTAEVPVGNPPVNSTEMGQGIPQSETPPGTQATPSTTTPQEGSQVSPQSVNIAGGVTFNIGPNGTTVPTVNTVERAKQLGFTEEESAKLHQQYGDEQANKYLDQVEQGTIPLQKMKDIINLGNYMAEQNENATPSKKMEPREKKMVTVDEMAALKDQIKREAKAAKEGAKEVQTQKNNFVKAISEAIGKLTIPQKQMASILSRIAKVNLLNDKHIDRIIKYVEKVATDAEYAGKVSAAEKNAAAVKAKVKEKAKPYTPQQREIMAQFSDLNPEDVSDIDEYNRMAEHILAPSKAAKGDKYAPMVTDLVKQYLDRENILATADEVGNAPTDQKQPDVSELVEKVKERVEALQQGLPTTGLPGRIMDLLKSLDKIGLDKLKPELLSDIIKGIDNILYNQDYGALGDIYRKVYAAINAPKIPIPKILAKGWRAVMGTELTQIPTYIENMYGTKEDAAAFQAYANTNKVFGANSEVERATDKMMGRWKDAMARFGKSAFKHDTLTLLSQFGELMQFDEYETAQEGFDKAKANIIQDLENKKNSESRQEEYEAESKVWEILKDINTPEEAEKLIKNKYPAVYAHWKFLLGEFNALEHDFVLNTEILYNKKLRKVNNYLPLRTFRASDLYQTEAVENPKDIENLTQSKYAPKPKAASTTISRVTEIGKDRVRDRNVLSAVRDFYHRTLYDIKVSPEIMAASSAMNAVPEIQRSGIVSMYTEALKKQMGITKPMAEASKIIGSLATTMTRIGYITGLGSVSAGVVQFLSSLTNTIAHLAQSGDLNLLFQSNKGAEKVLDKYTIGSRAVHMGGLKESDMMLSQAKTAFAAGAGKVASFLSGLSEATQPITLASFTYGDFIPAKMAWCAYYKQKLQQQGVEFTSWEEEAKLQDTEERKLAAAHAEQMIDTNLSSSQREKQASALTSPDVVHRLVKSVLFPFPSYNINLKQRLAYALTHANKKLYRENLIAILSEVAVTRTVGAVIGQFIASQIEEAVRGAFDYPSDDERDDDEKRKMFWQLVKGNIFKDLFPAAINNQVGDWSLEGANLFQYAFLSEEADYEPDQRVPFKEWAKENGWFKTFDTPINENLGMLSMFLSHWTGMEEVAKIAFNSDDTITVKDYYGNEVTLDLDDETRNIMEFNSLLSILAMGGVNIRELTSSVRKMRSQKIRESK